MPRRNSNAGRAAAKARNNRRSEKFQDRKQKLINELPEKSKPMQLRLPIRPRNQSQQDYIGIIDSYDLTFGLGPAGTGKTWLAVAKAAESLVEKEVEKIILVRPAVEAGEKLGFLPGSLQEKLDPYMQPLYDALEEMLGASRVKLLMENRSLEIAPLAFMRGRTLKNAFIILDEAQNTTFDQMKMLLTRFGEGSKMVVTGDASQVDLTGGQKSGLAPFVNLLRNVRGVGIHEFKAEDIVRHPLVTRIVKAVEHAA